MPTMAQMGTLPNILTDSLLSKSPLWQRELRTIKPFDLSLFIRLHKGTTNYFRAVREVEELKTSVMQANIDGTLDDQSLDILDHDKPREVFTSGDLVEWLENTTLARRRALLFALEQNLDPRRVVELEWADLRKMNLSLMAREILQSMPRHIRLPYVFWDTLPNGSAAPLFGLNETVLEVTQGLGMAVMQRLYGNMVMLDANAEAKAFQLELSLQ